MSRKGFERHQRKYQAKQQTADKFKNIYKVKGYGLFPDITIVDYQASEKLVKKVIK